MRELRRILVGAEFGGASWAAIERACSLARETGARCTALHAVSLDPRDRLRALLGSEAEFADERVINAAQRRLATLLEQTSCTAGVDIVSVVRSGRPARELITYAQDERCDILALGEHRTSRLQRFFLGSTTSRVLRQSDVSVLVVRNEGQHPYRRVLIGVDFSPTSQALIRASCVLAPDAEITLIHVCNDAMEFQMRYASVSSAVIGLYRVNVERDAQQQLVQVSDGSGLKGLSTHVAHGDPSHTILEFAREGDFDLIMMGKHGADVSQELLLGSVTKGIVEQADADVFVMVDPRRPHRDVPVSAEET